MRPDTLFAIFSYGILLPWALLAFAPRWSLTVVIPNVLLWNSRRALSP